MTCLADGLMLRSLQFPFDIFDHDADLFHRSSSSYCSKTRSH
jgi:hypothetical protein